MKVEGRGVRPAPVAGEVGRSLDAAVTCRIDQGVISWPSEAERKPQLKLLWAEVPQGFDDDVRRGDRADTGFRLRRLHRQRLAVHLLDALPDVDDLPFEVTFAQRSVARRMALDVADAEKVANDCVSRGWVEFETHSVRLKDKGRVVAARVANRGGYDWREGHADRYGLGSRRRRAGEGGDR